MKVNIAGKGIIPGVNKLPPVYNYEMSENEIRRLLNFTNIRLYCSDTGKLITKNNISSMFAVSPINDVKVSKPKNEKKNVSESIKTTEPENDVVNDNDVHEEIASDVTEEQTKVEESKNTKNNNHYTNKKKNGKYRNNHNQSNGGEK